MAGGSNDPFASANSNHNPFGGLSNDPFGGQPSGNVGPAGASQDLQPDFGNPFGGPASSSDPFAVSTGGGFVQPAPSDPFGGYSAASNDPFAPYGGGGAGSAFGHSPSAVTLSPSQSPAQVPMGAPNSKSPGNPFASSGLHQHMLSDKSKKSVADPFSTLNVLSPTQGGKAPPPAAAAPMR
eukprot:scaffold674615_cov37-Prasinocladus_malaysianus.AAC.1